MISQMTPTGTPAAPFGQTAFEIRAARSRAPPPGAASPKSSASSPARVVSLAMAANLLAKPAGGHAGQSGHRGGADPPRTLHRDGVFRDDPARPAGQQDDAVAEADRLADVVRDEQHGEPLADPL